MRTVTFNGGPCDGMTAEIDPRDALFILRAATLPGEPRRVVVLGAGGPHGATPFHNAEDYRRAHGLFVDYHRWPSPDDGPIDYRAEVPPEPVYRSRPAGASG